MTAITYDILFLGPIVLCEAVVNTTWNSWGACRKIPGNLDQNCIGNQTRTGFSVDSDANYTRTPLAQSQDCNLTSGESMQMINEGYQRSNKNS